MKFSERLKHIMTELNASKSVFAYGINTSRQTVSNWLKRDYISPRAIELIEPVLGQDCIAFLIGQTDQWEAKLEHYKYFHGHYAIKWSK